MSSASTSAGTGSAPGSRLLRADRPLCELYDVALLDLDGVVYVGDRPVDGASEALAAARRAGMRLAFVTNNASRTPGEVADRLSHMGVPASTAEVTTSAMAAAHALAERLDRGAPVLVVGGKGLRDAVADRGLHPIAVAVDPDTGRPAAAVVQGFASDVNWAALAEAAVAIRAGAWWLATNVDATIPSERGPLPGNGSLVNVLRFAFGFEPANTGKPDPAMHRESVERSGAKRPLVVGDRLDTDIAGAHNAGAPSLLVLSGVTDGPGLLAAPPGARPDYIARDVAGVLRRHPSVEWSDARDRRGRGGGRDDGHGGGDGAGCHVGRFQVTPAHRRRSGVSARAASGDTGDLVVSSRAGGDGPGHANDDTSSGADDHSSSSGVGDYGSSSGVGDDDKLDLLRAVAVAAWWWHDQHGAVPTVVGADDVARTALSAWGLG